MNTKRINLVKGFLFIGISVYLSYIFNDALVNFVSKIPFTGWVKGSIILRIVISLAFARGLQLILKAFEIKIKSILILFIGTLIGFTINFIAQPIYNTDYGDFGSEKLKIDISELENLSFGTYFLYFTFLNNTFSNDDLYCFIIDWS